MSLTDSEVRGYKAGKSRQVETCGDALFLVIEPIGKGGGKSFMGVMRFPPCSPKNGGKRVEYRIGPYGKGVGKWSLKEARNEWERVRTWSRENNRDPRDLKKEQQSKIEKSSGPTFAEACQSYLSNSTSKASKKEYPNLLNYQVIPRLGGDTPVEQLSWDHKGPGGKNGRERVMEVFRSKVAEGKEPQAEKLLMVMRGVFDHAIDQGWMDRNQNPALGTRGTKTKHKATPHPTLPWDQLPQFFEDLERNEANGTLVLCAAVKVVLMTFLRVGSLTPMRWEELDESKDLWMIPGARMKSGQDHLVPLTEPLKEVLDSLRKVNGGEEFVFASPRSRGIPYLNPYSINQHFIRLGYKGVQTAHGLRRTALTAGQEVLGFPAELIQRQLSHAVGDKVRQAYDDSTLIDERRKFMIAWCDSLLTQGMKV